jgi:hypothetical protein
VTASVTHGRALRYAKGSARGLLHNHRGHCPACMLEQVKSSLAIGLCDGAARYQMSES